MRSLITPMENIFFFFRYAHKTVVSFVEIERQVYVIVIQIQMHAVPSYRVFHVHNPPPSQLIRARTAAAEKCCLIIFSTRQIRMTNRKENKKNRKQKHRLRFQQRTIQTWQI